MSPDVPTQQLRGTSAGEELRSFASSVKGSASDTRVTQ